MQDKIFVHSLEGNTQKLDGGAMFGNAPRAVWQKWIAPDELGRIPLACRSLLLEQDDKKILFETGIGAFFEPELAERFGVQNPDRHILLESLSSKGIKQEDIDFVVLSHLHFDHAGGLLPAYAENKKALLFPNATYVVGEEAWARALKPHARDRASFIPELTQMLKDSGRLEILKDNQWKKFNNIHFFISNGHTPGQYVSIIKGLNRKIAFCGDLIPGKHWMHIPITMGYDRYPEMLIDEKQAFYAELKEKQDILFFTHDPDDAAATFGRDDKGKIIVVEIFKTLDALPI